MLVGREPGTFGMMPAAARIAFDWDDAGIGTGTGDSLKSGR